MGYSTDFEGIIKIDPPLPVSLSKKVRAFLDAPPQIAEIWTYHCDYELCDDGAGIRWNGSEKSYDMDAWLPVLIEKFFAPKHVLNGVLRAQGERMADRWRLVVKDNIVQKLTGHREIDPSEAVDQETLTVFLNTDYGKLDPQDCRELAASILKHFTVVRK